MGRRLTLRPSAKSRRNHREPERRPRGERGFTLIEVVIAVFIVAIFAAIAIPTYQRHVEKSLETILITDIQNIAFRLDGIVKEDPDALPDDLTAYFPPLDPWKRPYQYLRLYNRPANANDARKDHNLHPINTYFDLYSMGPDGDTHKNLQNPRSRDDIIRANDGAFIGKASLFDP